MEQLDVDIVPYIVLLVVPVLGRMSDPSDSVRFMATQCFATLIRLLPLEVCTSHSILHLPIWGKEGFVKQHINVHLVVKGCFHTFSSLFATIKAKYFWLFCYLV